MWIADDDKIYAYVLATGAHLPSLDFNTLRNAENRHPQGLWSDGTTMWVADYADDRIYAYNMPADH